MKNSYQKETKTYSKKQIINAKTPMEFIHRCIYTTLSNGEKQVASREWRNKTGHTVKDIMYARHRHPYWKLKKHVGHKERYVRRNKLHRYFEVSGRKSFKRYTDEELLEFVKMNKVDKDGNYPIPDKDIAKHFGTSIPSVQYLRRKLNCSLTILEKGNKTYTETMILNLIKDSEHVLRRRSKI